MTTTEPHTTPRTLPSTAGAARDQVRDLLHTTGCAPPPQSVIDDILLVVSELVTNAHRHAGGLTGFTAHVADGTLTVRATDASPSDPTTPGGFGWPLIQKLSRHVTVTPLGTGKTIQVVLDTVHQRA
ncbi:ATP-binding protein [Streptomyces sp. NPDC006324]|uniref:ATP-binding protein n=1 Tax=Streptomyces sp. NPDC006324 TaxID=3156751 RepID=UPI00339FC6A1